MHGSIDSHIKIYRTEYAISSVCLSVCLCFLSLSLSLFFSHFPKIHRIWHSVNGWQKISLRFPNRPKFSALCSHYFTPTHNMQDSFYLVWGEWGVWQSSSLLQKFERAALQKCSLYWRYIRFKAFSDNVQIRESTKCVEFASVPFFLLEVHIRKTQWYLQLTSHTELK